VEEVKKVRINKPKPLVENAEKFTDVSSALKIGSKKKNKTNKTNGS
jgi:hypothetical protein